MDFNSDFRFDLKIGKIYENKLSDLLGKKIEVKSDFIALKTGNIFVEYECRKVPSGIATTEAEWWCYWLSEGHLVMIKTELLKNICRKYLKTERDIQGGDSNTSRGVLLPLNELFLSKIYEHKKPEK